MNDPLFYVRAVHFAATLLVAGVAFFLVFIAEPAFRNANNDATIAATVRHRLNWIGRISLTLAVISGAAWFDLTAAAMSGRPAANVFTQGVWWTVLSDTTFGNAWLVRFALACALAALFDPSLAARRVKSDWIKSALVISAAAFAGSLAFAGHAAGGLGLEAFVHQPADVVHLIAASAWVGALIPLVVLLQAVGREATPIAIARTATFRFSTLGIVAVGTLLVTGGINAWYLVGSISALTGTEYGRLLLVKIALFLVMVAIAAFNLLRLTPRIAQRESARTARHTLRKLRWNAGIEAAAGAIVLAIVAVLGTLPPAAHRHTTYISAVPADAAFVHIHSEQGMAEVTILPGRIGTANATIHLWDDDFNVLPARELSLALTPPATGSTMTRPAVQDLDQAWHVDGIELGQAGNWMVTVRSVLGSGKPLVLEAPIVIEGKR